MRQTGVWGRTIAVAALPPPNRAAHPTQANPRVVGARQTSVGVGTRRHRHYLRGAFPPVQRTSRTKAAAALAGRLEQHMRDVTIGTGGGRLVMTLRRGGGRLDLWGGSTSWRQVRRQWASSACWQGLRPRPRRSANCAEAAREAGRGGSWTRPAASTGWCATGELSGVAPAAGGRAGAPNRRADEVAGQRTRRMAAGLATDGAGDRGQPFLRRHLFRGAVRGWRTCRQRLDAGHLPKRMPNAWQRADHADRRRPSRGACTT